MSHWFVAALSALLALLPPGAGLSQEIDPSAPKFATVDPSVVSKSLAPTGTGSPPRNAAGDPSGAALSQKAAIGVDVIVGYVGYDAPIKPGLWYPLWVSVAAGGEDLSGRLIIQQEGNPLRVELSVDVPQGTIRRFITYYLFSEFPPNLAAEIQGEGLETQSFRIGLRFQARNAQHVLVLTEEPGAFAFLKRTAESKLPVVERARQEGEAAARNSLPDISDVTLARSESTILHGLVEFLPDDPIALEPLDAIILDTDEVGAISQAQWEAIQTWVRHGGRLVLSAGSHQPFIEESLLAGAFGLSLAAPESIALSRIPAMARDSDEAEILAAWPEGPWDDIRLGDADRPFLVSRNIGRGWFHLCAAALDRPMVEAIRRSLEDRAIDPLHFWRDLLDRHEGDAGLQRIALNASTALASRLQRTFLIRGVGAFWVFKYLAGYILLAVVVNWWICRRLRRTGWAWPVAVVLAGGFAVYGYRSGAGSQEQTFQLNEVTFLSRPAGTGSVRATTISAVFSPRRLSTNLTAPGGLFPIPLADAPTLAPRSPALPSASVRRVSLSPDLYAGRPITVSFGDPAQLRDFFLFPWSVRNVQTTFSLKSPARIEGGESTELDADDPRRLKGAIRNGTEWTFRRWWIRNGWNLWSGPQPLTPGSRVDLAELKLVRELWPNVVRNSLKETFRQPVVTIDARQSSNRYIDRQETRVLMWQDIVRLENRVWEDITGFSGAYRAGFVFLGEADGSLSPMMSELNSEKTLGLLFYEEDLRQVSVRRQPSDARWELLVAHGDGFDIVWPSSESLGVSSRAVFGQEALVRLVPDEPFSPGGTSKVEVSFDLRARRGGAEEVFSALASRAPSLFPPAAPRRSGDRSELFRFIGCRIRLYNVRSGSWEDQEIRKGGLMTLDPFVDYLDPETFSILFAVDGSPDGIFFERLETKGDFEELMKDPDIFESPSNLVVQIRDFTLKFHDSGRDGTRSQ